MSKMIVKTLDLGFVFGRLQYTEDNYSVNLILMSPDLEKENGTILPARSVQIYDRANLITLRDALNDALSGARDE